MKWTREQIIRAILQREAAGLPLNTGGDQGVDATLYQAGARFFGSWRNAVMAAGISQNRVYSHDRWPPSRILATIRTLAKRRRPPQKAELKQRYDCLVAAARRAFGSWPKAVIAAGADPTTFMKVPPWTRDRVIEAILVRVLRNDPLGSTTVRPRSLSDAAVRVFGNWGSALVAAGLDPKRHMACTRRSFVHESSESAHGPIIPAGGVPPALSRPNQRWSREAVCQAILVRLSERRPMNASAVRIDDKTLYWASKKRYGSWRDALRAAGLNPEKFRQQGGRRRTEAPASDGIIANRRITRVTS